MPKPKKITTPELLMEYFHKYRQWAKNTPYEEHDFIGPKAIEVKRYKERCLSLEGFENWCYNNGYINDLGDYFSNNENRYSEYATICTRIKKIIRQDQIEGGMAGIYNPSITQRLNGLVEKSEQTIKQEQPLFPDTPNNNI